MKIGTDGALLGVWCACENAQNILDIGTGTGLIALMIAQRNLKATIDAVELDKTAADEALFNFLQSPWAKRLSVINEDVRHFQPNKRYDLIASNPPFFEYSSPNKTQQKTIARHTIELSFEELIKKTGILLSGNGVFSVILPISASNKFVSICTENNLHLIRKTAVYANLKSQYPFRHLLEFCRNKQAIKQNNITIEKSVRHDYTEEYKTLCRDFFLKF